MNGAAEIRGVYDDRLIVLSVLIAIFSSYTALDLSGRVMASHGVARRAWLTGGAFAMGSGIWSMHYTGMLAFRLPLRVYYHVPTVLLSLLAAILASLVALFVVSRQRLTAPSVVMGSVLMGGGIAAMHYTGMASMRLAAMHSYDPGIWVLSVVLAVGIAMAALRFTYSFREGSRGLSRQLLTATILGLAIPVMHYTGMAAVHFMPTSVAPDLSYAVDISKLASSGIILITLVILGFAVMTSVVDRRLSGQARELAVSEQRYQMLFQSNPAAVLVFHFATLRLLTANHAAIGTYGFTLAELLRMKITDLHRSSDLTTLLGRGSSNIEAQHLRKDGSSIDVELKVGNISWDGQPAILLLVHDITERKDAQRQRDLMEVQLRQSQKLESIGQLAAGIAHEINTPAQFIGNNVRFLQDAFRDLGILMSEYERVLAASGDAPLTEQAMLEVSNAVERADRNYLLEEVPKAIQQTLEGVDRVRTLVSAMKEFSHPGGRERSPIDLNHSIESTVVVTRHEWKHVADLETEYDPSLPLISCLPGEFNQVVLNLIVNAAHAVADTQATPGEPRGKIKIRTINRGDWAEIRIEDSGTGIPQAVRPRIFDPFFTTKAVGKGTGQGLAIAHSVIVDKHRGSISFETSEGIGTTFIIRLPFDGKSLPANAAANELSLSRGAV